MIEQNTLYILKCKVTGLIKIGVTCNLQGRLRGIGGSMEVLHYYQIDNPRYYEKFLHKKFKKFNVINHTVKTGFTEFFNLTN
ncbi:MAG: GIY-YIG nuclease family protein [Phocaeicola sp.]